MATPHLHKKLRLAGKIAAGLVVFIFLAMLVIPRIFQDMIDRTLRDYASRYLTSELYFADSHLSFFTHFPALSMSLDSVRLAGSDPFGESNLVDARKLSVSVNLFPLLFSQRVQIDGIYLDQGNVQILVDERGNPNYNVYRVSDTTNSDGPSESEVDIDHIRIRDTRLEYADALRGLRFRTRRLDYRGSGSFHGEHIEIGSRLQADSADIEIDQIPYLLGKTLNGNIELSYDSETLVLDFGNNYLSINDLDLTFSGEVRVDPEATLYDLQVHLEDGKLSDVISALPPEYVSWQENVRTSGRMDATLHLIRSLATGGDSVEVSDIYEFDIGLHDGFIQHQSVPLPVENLQVSASGSLAAAGFNVILDTLNFSIGSEYSRGTLVAEGRKDSLGVEAYLDANLDLGTLSESLKLPNLSFRGVFRGDLQASGTYQPSANLFPKSTGNLVLNDGFVQTSFPEPIRDIQLDMQLANRDGTMTGTSLDFGRISLVFVENPFEMTASFHDFHSPQINIQAKGAMDLLSLSQIYPFPGFSADGFVRMDLNIKGGMVREQTDSTETKRWEFEERSGTLFLEGITMNTAYLPKPVEIINGDFTFWIDRLEFKDFLLKYDTNYSEINGYFKNYLQYFLLPDGILLGEFNFASERIDVDKLMPKVSPERPAAGAGPVAMDSLAFAGNPVATDSLALARSDSTGVRDQVAGVIQVPPRINFKLNLDVDTLKYFELEMHDLAGELTIIESGLILKKGRLRMVGGQAAVEGFYNPVRTDQAVFSFLLKAEELDIQRAYTEIELFRNLLPAAENARGLVGFDYELAGILDGKMYPVMTSLEGGGIVSARDIGFKGYRLFGTVSQQTSIDALNDPSVKEIAFKSRIDSNLVDIERFKFKVPPFRLRMEGQTSLDGDLNLQMRVGLPPFGIIGIPIGITGDSDEMHIKLGKRTRDLKGIEFDEDELSEDERLRFDMLRDSITDDMDVEAIQAMEQRLDSISLDSLLRPVDTLALPVDSPDTGVDALQLAVDPPVVPADIQSPVAQDSLRLH